MIIIGVFFLLNLLMIAWCVDFYSQAIKLFDYLSKLTQSDSNNDFQNNSNFSDFKERSTCSYEKNQMCIQ